MEKLKSLLHHRSSRCQKELAAVEANGVTNCTKHQPVCQCPAIRHTASRYTRTHTNGSRFILHSLHCWFGNKEGHPACKSPATAIPIGFCTDLVVCPPMDSTAYRRTVRILSVFLPALIISVDVPSVFPNKLPAAIRESNMLDTFTHQLKRTLPLTTRNV